MKIRAALGDGSGVRTGSLVRSGHRLAFLAGAAVFLVLSCGRPNDATVGTEHLDAEGGQGAVDPGTGGTDDAGGTSAGGTRGGGGTSAGGSRGGTGDVGGVSTGGAGGPGGTGNVGGTLEGGAGGRGGTGNVGGTGNAGGTPLGGTGGGSGTGNVGGTPVGGMGGAGMGNVGGTPVGGMGGAGTGGAAGAGGSVGTISALVGALDGRLMQFPCGDAPSTDDCNGFGYVVDGVVTPCVNGQSEMVLDHPIAGTRGARYLVTMHFYGIMEPKNLGSGVTRDAPIGVFSDRNGGTPLPWASAPGGTNYAFSTYTAYEIRVHDDVGQEIARYFLNSDAAEGHWTFLIDYEKTIEVVGGGFVRLRRLDNNCRLIKNCGAAPGFPCDMKARVIDVSEADPPAPDGAYPSGLNQPGLNRIAQHAGQWWFIDVTAAVAL